MLYRHSDESKTLMQVALGQEKADLAVINARLANVYTGEILDDFAVSTKGRWIAYLGRNPEGTIGPRTKVIDADGQTVIPGLIDGHTHLSWLCRIDEFLKYAARGGTTTIVSETLEVFPVGGLKGLMDYLDSFQNQPVKIWATAPVMISISKAARGISRKDLQKLLEREDIIGLGESYWQAVLQDPDWLLALFEQAQKAGKTLEGHTAGASEKKLAAYIANGITSCHEPINAEQVRERLRLGLHVMIREGAVRKDLAEIAKIKDLNIDSRRLILASDSISPDDLMANGYMEAIVQKAIACGFEPIEALQMATLNVAEHFGLDHLIGGLAPGRFADFVVIPDIANIDAQVVVSNGKVIARNGTLLVTPRPHVFDTASLNSVKLPRDLKSSDFAIHAPEDTEQIHVRLMNMVTDLVTAEITEPIAVRDGQIHIDPQKDMAKIAAIDRTHKPGQMFVGLIKGFGIKSGAIGCSAAWDSTDIIVIGRDDSSMAAAVNRIRSLQGGVVICQDADIVAELPLPIFGLIAELKIEDLVSQFAEVTRAARNRGIPFPEPVLSLITLTGAAIPYLRICEEGLVNLKNGKTVSLFVEKDR
ncbi:MAG: adenine deaminase C-terminal domain-containing protein [Desulfobacterales bacterium]|jgi:adenine deaminase